MTTVIVDSPSLAKRVEQLESANRRWRLASVFLLLIIAASLATSLKSQARGEPPIRSMSVESQTFRLVDSGGMVRGRFAMQGGKPILELYDQAGKVLWSTAQTARIIPGR